MAPSESNLEDLRILVVDDSFEALNLIKLMLKELGINQVFTAKDGREALQFLGTTDILGTTDEDVMVNVVLCDWNMPRMNGLELLAQVRTVDPDMPFLMITGCAELHFIQEAKSYGVSGYIKKPFSLVELHNKLSALARIVAHRQ